MIKLIILALVIWYVFNYSCIYTSYIMYNVLDSIGLNPVYKAKDMIGTEYYHAYIEVNGYDLFLNPFRKYGKARDSIPSNELNQWGEFYNPITKQFMRIF